MPGSVGQPGVTGPQGSIVAGQRIGLCSQSLSLLILSLMQTDLPQVVLDGGIAWLYAQRPLQVGSCLVQLAGVKVLGSAFQ